MASAANPQDRSVRFRLILTLGSGCRGFRSLALATLLSTPVLSAQPTADAAPAQVIERRGRVDFARGSGSWMAVTATNLPFYFQDRLHTRDFSRASLLLAERDVVRVDELTLVELERPTEGDLKLRVKLASGSLYYFHRGVPRELEVETPAGRVGSRTTEFHVAVESTGRTTVSVLDGSLTVSNRAGFVEATNLDQVLVEPGRKPVLGPPLLQTVNIIQWCLYYPGVLDVNELGFTTEERAALKAPIIAYERGNLMQALENYPAGRTRASTAEKQFYAGLLLSVGRVDDCEAMLRELDPGQPAVHALRWLIAAVKHQPLSGPDRPVTASEHLAFAYYAQSFYAEHGLKAALHAAEEAVRLSPGFGFARAKLAELAFSFGHREWARRELELALSISPENAQARALQGFVLAAHGRWKEARAAFEQAISVDSGLGNAWLGRGLCRIRDRDAAGGRQDLEIAAALEPNRSFLRSYLAKAFSQEGDDVRAEKELALARDLDLEDPTPLLYQALLDRQLNRINPAISALEESVALNNNRRLYRSRFLLDQDRAVRESSLATLYHDAGLQEVSLREASRSVNSDYANDAAHLFLSGSYNALRDPKRVNLRYETAWFNERLLANLMAPVEGGNLSQQISNYEYSRFFSVPGPSLQGSVEYLSTGEWHVLGTQAGNFSRTAYALDVDYLHQPGDGPNADFDRLEWYSQLKQQITPADAVFLLTKYMDFSGGDILQYYDPAEARRNYSFQEDQQPILLAAYQHLWQPGIQTLLLAGRLDDDFRSSNQGQNGIVIDKLPDGTIERAGSYANLYDVEYENRDQTYTAELNQVIENDRHLLVLGGRFVGGNFRTRNEFTNLSPGLPPFDTTPDPGFHSVDVLRASGYGYYTFKAGRTLLLTAGLSYDYLEYPENFLYVPVSRTQIHTDQVSPKLAVAWSPSPTLNLRGIWSRTLGGVTFDESIRLEPTQLAGFIQSYRSVISETEVGSVSAPETQTAGLGADWNPYAGAYTGFQLEHLAQEVDRSRGVFDVLVVDGVTSASQTPESLDYDEYRASVYYSQLLAEAWSVRLAYQFVRSELDQRLTAVEPQLYSRADYHQEADLHQAWAQLLYNHPKGWFGRAEAVWSGQNYLDSEALETEESVWQFHLFFGYRLARQRGDLLLGVVNLTDVDYRLQPLNPYLDLPRERALYVRVRFNF